MPQSQLAARQLNFTGLPVELVIAIGDEDTAAETGTSLVTFRMPFAMTLNTGSNGVRGSSIYRIRTYLINLPKVVLKD